MSRETPTTTPHELLPGPLADLFDSLRRSQETTTNIAQQQLGNSMRLTRENEKLTQENKELRQENEKLRRQLAAAVDAQQSTTAPNRNGIFGVNVRPTTKEGTFGTEKQPPISVSGGKHH